MTDLKTEEVDFIRQLPDLEEFQSQHGKWEWGRPPEIKMEAYQDKAWRKSMRHARNLDIALYCGMLTLAFGPVVTSFLFARIWLWVAIPLFVTACVLFYRYSKSIQEWGKKYQWETPIGINSKAEIIRAHESTDQIQKVYAVLPIPAQRGSALEKKERIKFLELYGAFQNARFSSIESDVEKRLMDLSLAQTRLKLIAQKGEAEKEAAEKLIDKLQEQQTKLKQMQSEVRNVQQQLSNELQDFLKAEREQLSIVTIAESFALYEETEAFLSATQERTRKLVENTVEYLKALNSARQELAQFTASALGA